MFFLRVNNKIELSGDMYHRNIPQSVNCYKYVLRKNKLQKCSSVTEMISVTIMIFHNRNIPLLQIYFVTHMNFRNKYEFP